MVGAPVRSIIPSLKLGDYLSVQAHKQCSISHIYGISRQYVAIKNLSSGIQSCPFCNVKTVGHFDRIEINPSIA